MLIVVLINVLSVSPDSKYNVALQLFLLVTFHLQLNMAHWSWNTLHLAFQTKSTTMRNILVYHCCKASFPFKLQILN